MRCVHPDDLQSVLDDRTAAVGERRETMSEFRAVRPDGELRWVHVRTKPMLADDDTTLGHVGTVEDITVRKQAEAARAEDARISAALAHVGRELISSLETPVLLDRLCRLSAELLECRLQQYVAASARERCVRPRRGTRSGGGSMGGVEDDSLRRDPVRRARGAAAARVGRRLHPRATYRIRCSRAFSSGTARKSSAAFRSSEATTLIGLQIAAYRESDDGVLAGAGAHRAGSRPAGIDGPHERATRRGDGRGKSTQVRVHVDDVPRAAHAVERDPRVHRDAVGRGRPRISVIVCSGVSGGRVSTCSRWSSPRWSSTASPRAKTSPVGGGVVARRVDGSRRRVRRRARQTPPWRCAGTIPVRWRCIPIAGN